MKGDVFNGQCICGCGGFTTVLKWDDPVSGRKAGQHKQYIHGHYYRHMRHIGKVSGEQMDKQKDREKRRTDLVKAILETHGTKSLQEIAKQVAPGHPLESCSQLINNARKWRWVNGHIYQGEIPRIIIRPQVQKVEPYERREIPYERETDIPLLVNQRRAILLDAPLLRDETSDYHSVFGSPILTPLEMLLLKEEIESEEWQEKEKRIMAWNAWEARKKSSFSNELRKIAAI